MIIELIGKVIRFGVGQGTVPAKTDERFYIVWLNLN